MDSLCRHKTPVRFSRKFPAVTYMKASAWVIRTDELSHIRRTFLSYPTRKQHANNVHSPVPSNPPLEGSDPTDQRPLPNTISETVASSYGNSSYIRQRCTFMSCRQLGHLLDRSASVLGQQYSAGDPVILQNTGKTVRAY